MQRDLFLAFDGVTNESWVWTPRVWLFQSINKFSSRLIRHANNGADIDGMFPKNCVVFGDVVGV